MTDLPKRVDLVQKGGFVAGTNLVTKQITALSCTEGQVLLDIRATAVNPVDWKMAEMGFLMNQVEGKPTALGCDVAGTIVAVPSDESR